MKPKNVILVTMDEVRPDHLGCYGYKRIETPNLDRFAREGVRFETVVSASCFTPPSHASILTGVYQYNHNLRDPFSRVEWKMLAEIFHERGYSTAGFVGVNLLGRANGFDAGFDDFDEPKPDEIWKRSGFAGDDRGELLWGNWWVPRMLDWIRAHADTPFFIWGHYFDVHQAAEKILLETGKIREGVLSEFGYYDAKIRYMDEALFAPLRALLDELALHEQTTVVITSDHGTNLGEHEVPPFPNLDLVYPQHTTLYDCDLLVPLILRDRDLPHGVVIPGAARTVDIVPTILESAGLAGSIRFDGVSLISSIAAGRVEGLTCYSEELYEKRGPGDYQSIRSDRYKFIIDRRSGREEFYDLSADPLERNNLIAGLTEEQQALVEEWRAFCDSHMERKESGFVMDVKDRERIEKRLRLLGYIE
ncbi:MAG: sulfatase [Deltaproteobacteria bacterium]|nr:sulfatase [Deltaproteobacteria bacterium]